MQHQEKPQAYNGRELKAKFIECLWALREKAADFDKENFDSTNFQVKIAVAVWKLKEVCTTIAQSGFLEGMTQLGKVNDELVSIVRSADNKVKDLVIDAVIDQFPAGEHFLKNCRVSSPEIRLKVLRAAMLQADAPEQLGRSQVSLLPEKNTLSEEFLPAFMTALELCSPPHKAFDAPELIVLFSELKFFMMDQSNERIPLAVEFVAAHMSVFAPVVKHFLHFMASEADQARRKLVTFRLAMDAEFLVGLYESTQSEVIKALAEFTMDDPQGSMAYSHFDRIGVSRSPGWHFQEQERTSLPMKRACLYEYAVMTPGVAVNPSILPPMDLTGAQACVNMLKTVPLIDLDAGIKAHQVFHVLAKECEMDTTGKIKALLASSCLPKELFMNHLNLLGERFGHDMGL